MSQRDARNNSGDANNRQTDRDHVTAAYFVFFRSTPLLVCPRGRRRHTHAPWPAVASSICIAAAVPPPSTAANAAKQKHQHQPT